MIRTGLGVLVRSRQLPVLVLMTLGLHLITKIPLPFPAPDAAAIRTSPFPALLDMFSGGAAAYPRLAALGLVPYAVATYVLPPRRDRVWWHIPGLTALIAAVLANRLWRSVTPSTSAVGNGAIFVLALVAGAFLCVGVVWLCDTYWSIRFDGPKQWTTQTSEASRWRRVLAYLFVSRTELEPGTGMASWIAVAFTVNLLGTIPGYVALGATTPGQIAYRGVTLIVCAAVLLILSLGIRRIPTRAARAPGGSPGQGAMFDRPPAAETGLPLAPCSLALSPLYLVLGVIGLVNIATLEQTHSFVAWIAALARFEQSMTDPMRENFWIVLILAGTAALYGFRRLIVIPAAERFKKDGTFIPGVRPGADTAFYLHRICVRLFVPGALAQMLVLTSPIAVATVLGDSGIWPLVLIPTALVLACLMRAANALRVAALSTSYTGLIRHAEPRANSRRE
jgi:preprotein translocase subunit SecY